MLGLAGWDGEELVIRHDGPSGAWIVIAVHSRMRGPAVGGTRLLPYDSPEAAIADALRLSRGMTLKNAAADLPVGGGKAVIAAPPDLSAADRAALLLRHAALVDSLGGRFVTGPDMGTSEPDMDLIGQATRHVFCRSRAAGGSGSASRWTAMGVFHGIRASVRHVYGSRDLRGRRVLVQGVGEVGGPLAGLLHAAGALLVLADVDSRRRGSVAARLPGSVVVETTDALGVECDVFAPCAMGGILDAETIDRLRCRIVAGAANNQLASAEDAARLRAAGILYAPDFVINAGGIIRGVGAEVLNLAEDEIDRRIEGIDARLEQIYRTADETGRTTDEVALAMALAALGGPSSTGPNGVPGPASAG